MHFFTNQTSRLALCLFFACRKHWNTYLTKPYLDEWLFHLLPVMTGFVFNCSTQFMGNLKKATPKSFKLEVGCFKLLSISPRVKHLPKSDECTWRRVWLTVCATAETLGPSWPVCVSALRHAQNVNKKASTSKQISPDIWNNSPDSL